MRCSGQGIAFSHCRLHTLCRAQQRMQCKVCFRERALLRLGPDAIDVSQRVCKLRFCGVERRSFGYTLCRPSPSMSPGHCLTRPDAPILALAKPSSTAETPIVSDPAKPTQAATAHHLRASVLRLPAQAGRPCHAWIHSLAPSAAGCIKATRLAAKHQIQLPLALRLLLQARSSFTAGADMRLAEPA